MRHSAVLVSSSFRSKLVAFLLLLLSSEALGQTPLPPSPPPPPPEAEKYPRVGRNREIILGKGSWLRFGGQLQAWIDYAQTSTKAGTDDGGYSLNFFNRRARFIAAATFFDDLFVYV